MEIIRKQISIDKCRSHKNGLLPFVRYNNGLIETNTSDEDTNYGHYACDLSGETNVIKYLDLIRHYNEINEIIRNGIKCIKISNTTLRAYESIDTGNIKCAWMDYDICDDKYSFIIKDLSEFDINGDYYKSNAENSNFIDKKCYLLVSDFETIVNIEAWAEENNLIDNTIEVVGLRFIKYVEDNIINSKNVLNNGYALTIPVVEIPIYLEDEHDYNTLYFPYEYTISGDSVIDIYTLDNKDENIAMLTGLTLIGESKLLSLIDETAITLNDNFVGICCGWTDTKKIYEEYDPYNPNKTISGNVTYETSKLFKCKYYSAPYNSGTTPTLKNSNVYQAIIVSANETDGYKWWECIEESRNISGFTCVDGKIITQNTNNEYRNLMFLANISYYEPTPNNGDERYFLVRYQNGKINPKGNIDNEGEHIIKIKYPFVIGKKVNCEEYNGSLSYDKVTSIEQDGVFCKIKYIIGADEVLGEDNSGIHYEEDLLYISGVTNDIWVDGVIPGELYYETFDYYTNSIVVYNNYLDGETILKPANIKSMPTLTESSYYNVPLFTKEGTETMYFEPKIDVDISFNRGNASAWDKHFKLSECNTMQDLKNYGNNTFNL